MKYDEVMLDPPTGAICEALAKAAEAANKGSKCRRCYPMDVNVAEVAHSDEGRCWATGEIDPGKDTSMIGIAWWTDRKARKHVRVCSTRVTVKGKKAKMMFGVGSERWPPVHCVYPTAFHRVQGDLVIFKCKCGMEGTVDQICWDGRMCYACQNRQEYLEDTGFEKYEAK